MIGVDKMDVSVPLIVVSAKGERLDPGVSRQCSAFWELRLVTWADFVFQQAEDAEILDSSWKFVPGGGTAKMKGSVISK